MPAARSDAVRTSSASRVNVASCTCSAPKPFTTRTPDTVSSTTVDTSAASAWTASTAGWIRAENRLASTLTIGSGEQCAEGQQGVHGQQHGGDTDDEREVRQRERDHHDEGLHLLQVVAGPAHELSGLRPVVEADVERLQVGEEPLAQPTFGQARLPEGEVAAGGAQRPGDEADHDDGQRPHEERALAVDGLVDGRTDEEGDRDLGPAPQQPHQPAEGDAPLLGRQRGAEQAPPVTTATRGHQAPLLRFVDGWPTTRRLDPSARLPARVRDHPAVRLATRPVVRCST